MSPSHRWLHFPVFSATPWTRRRKSIFQSPISLSRWSLSCRKRSKIQNTVKETPRPGNQSIVPYVKQLRDARHERGGVTQLHVGHGVPDRPFPFVGDFGQVLFRLRELRRGGVDWYRNLDLTRKTRPLKTARHSADIFLAARAHAQSFPWALHKSGRELSTFNRPYFEDEVFA